MKTLTIKEPWATLIIEGHKRYEFRTWKTKYRGKIFIHAGKGIDKEAVTRFKSYHLQYASGQIIGEADIVDCIFVDDIFKEELLKENPEIYKNSEGYAFKLENIVKYEKPISCKGMLGLWNYESKTK